MMELQAYIGRTEVIRDHADPERMRRLAATLDHEVSPWRPGVLPPLGHWLCFQPDARQSEIGADGHPRRTSSGFLPNIDLPRRMWAGSRIQFLRDIPIGAPIIRTSTLSSATEKVGRSGRMLFVGVRHEITAEGEDIAIIEDQDIVYREASETGAQIARPAAKPRAPASGAVVRSIAPDPVMLFRYSALTFNGHRIHYDRSYATQEEGYPGLVIHGPLMATLLLDHLLRQYPLALVSSFAFRAVSPLFDGDTISLELERSGDEASLTAAGPAGPAVTATATIPGQS